jgi:hypothetical protein
MPMQFLRPDLAVWLLLLPLVFIFWLIHIKAKYRFRLDAGFGSTLQTLSHFSTSKRDITVLIVASLAVGAIVLAVMRPQLFIDRMVPEYERQDLVLVLDRSASMHARDVPPSRFTRAIQEIKSFLAEKPAEIDRVSLVGFAGTAITLSHLTRDLDTLFFFSGLDRRRPPGLFRHGYDRGIDQCTRTGEQGRCIEPAGRSDAKDISDSFRR